MSLFLQTLVLRGILFRGQEHRQERIGVGMTLWPTGRTRVEEANEIEIGNLHESGGGAFWSPRQTEIKMCKENVI